MSETNGAAASRPRPFRVDDPLRRVQTLPKDGDELYLFRHDLTRLDASNIGLLRKKEKATKRYAEKMAGGKRRPRFNETDADAELYQALVQRGGWRPALLQPTHDLGTIDQEWHDLYTQGEDKIWRPGWYELSREQCVDFVAERQKQAIDAYFEVAGEYVRTANKKSIDFMFEKGGTMRVRLKVGEAEDPAYRLLLDFRRPESKRRSHFREEFAFGIETTKGEGGKIETVFNYEQGTKFFAEHFIGAVDDPDHSLVLFTDDGEEGQESSGVRPYHPADRTSFLATFDSMYMVEAAATIVTAFSDTDRELQKR